MGKRSNFARAPRDFYPTPKEAVLPLLPHIVPGKCPLCRDTGMIARGLDVDICPACMRQAEVEWLLTRKEVESVVRQTGEYL